MKVLALLLTFALLGVEPTPLPGWVWNGPLPDGVSVQATAQADAAVSSIALTLGVTSRDHWTPIGASDVEPLVQALMRAGAARSDIALPPYSAGAPRVRVLPVTITVRQPTAAGIDRGIAELAHFLISTPNLWIETARAEASSDECAALRQQVDRDAVDQARANAERLAHYAGARIGSVLAIDGTNDASSYNSQPCSQTYTIMYPGAVMTAHHYLHIPVRSTVHVRFAISRQKEENG